MQNTRASSRLQKRFYYNMAPAQPLAVDGEDGKTKVVVKLEETDGDVDERKEKNELGLVCTSNFEDSAFYGDSRDRLACNALDQEVDVVGSGDGEVAELEKSDDPDATEQSSSFGNTFSGSEDEVKINMSDMEVDSQFSTENATEIVETENGEQPVPDELGRLLKKKKVTAHWRRFISPLMWRCQWLELRMNELRSQASLYDKELAAYKREKQLQSKMIELDDSVSRSVPLTCKNHRKRAMKRMKRKRIEDTVDITSYMSNHNIFSYYENKRSETDCQSVDNDCDDQADEVMKRNDDYEWVLNGLNRGDGSLEKILFNLDGLQSRVLSLKTQLSEVMSENIRDISRSATNFLREDPHIGYARSLSCSPPGNNGDAMPHHRLSEYELEVPESAVSSYGDAADVDTIECTIDLLSADALLHKRQGRDLYKDIADDVLINNQAGKEELKNFEKVSHGKVKLQEVAKEEAQSCSEDAKTAPKALAAAQGPSEQNGQPPVLKPGYTGKKRGRKPKRKRRGGCMSGLKSERIQKRRFN